MKKSSTPTLIKALEILSRDIYCEDGVATACLIEASQRMQELYDENEKLLMNSLGSSIKT